MEENEIAKESIIGKKYPELWLQKQELEDNIEALIIAFEKKNPNATAIVADIAFNPPKRFTICLAVEADYEKGNSLDGEEK